MPVATPQAVRDRALALLAQGMSTRSVAERLLKEGTPLSKSTIAELDKARRAGELKGPPKAAAPKPPAEAPLDENATLEELIDGASARDVRRLERTSTLFAQRIELALAMGDTKTLAVLTPLSMQIAKALAGLRPPPRPDPEADPANLAARDELRARIERLATEAELDDAKGTVTRAAIRAHLDRLDARAALPAEERVP